MVKPFSLQSVLELMQERADAATQQLARLIAAEQNAKNKLQMLEQYRDEYATRFQQAALHGLSQSQWRNYQDFLGKLDEAIDSQRKILRQEEKNTAQGQANWQQQKRKVNAFDTLSERHFRFENQRVAKLDQKMQDEFAARQKPDHEA